MAKSGLELGSMQAGQARPRQAVGIAGKVKLTSLWIALLVVLNAKQAKTTTSEGFNSLGCKESKHVVIKRTESSEEGVIARYEFIDDVLELIEEHQRYSLKAEKDSNGRVRCDDMFTCYLLCRRQLGNLPPQLSLNLGPDQYWIHDFFFIQGYDTNDKDNEDNLMSVCLSDGSIGSYTACEGTLEDEAGEFRPSEGYSVHFDDTTPGKIYIVVENRQNIRFKVFKPEYGQTPDNFICDVSGPAKGYFRAREATLQGIKDFIKKLDLLNNFITTTNDQFSQTRCKDLTEMGKFILSKLHNKARDNTVEMTCDKYGKYFDITETSRAQRNIFDFFSNSNKINTLSDAINKNMNDLTIVNANEKDLFDSLLDVNDNLQRLGVAVNQTNFSAYQMKRSYLYMMTLNRFIANLELRRQNFIQLANLITVDIYNTLGRNENMFTSFVNLLATKNLACEAQQSEIFCGKSPYLVELNEQSNELKITASKSRYSFEHVSQFRCLPRSSGQNVFAYNKQLFYLKDGFYHHVESKTKFSEDCLNTGPSTSYFCKTLFVNQELLSEDHRPYSRKNVNYVLVNNIIYYNTLLPNIKRSVQNRKDVLEPGKIYELTAETGVVDLNGNVVTFNVMLQRIENGGAYKPMKHVLLTTETDFQHLEEEALDTTELDTPVADLESFLRNPETIWSHSKLVRDATYTTAGIVGFLLLLFVVLLTLYCWQRPEGCCTVSCCPGMTCCRRTKTPGETYKLRVQRQNAERKAARDQANNSPLLPGPAQDVN